MEPEEKPFTVRDRRIAHGADEEAGAEPAGKAPQPPPREAAEAEAEAAGEAAPKASGAEAGAAPGQSAAGRPAEPSRAGSERAAAEAGFAMAGEPSPIDFSAFVFSLARTALIHLGLENHPETGRQEVHLGAARETIDVLGMLEEKTRGNLTPEEAELISKMLYTLRMSFVEVSKAGHSG